MRILLTNDDGVLSPVLHRTADALATRHDVTVVAPAEDQSGMAHAFTHGMGRLLTCHLDATTPWPLYRVSGTPADCVKFAVTQLIPGNLPDLVVSGPNLGENAGISAVYSGTVAAAREAALWGIPGLAVSLNETGRDADGRPVWPLDFALEWLLRLLDTPELLPAGGALWNVNFPSRRPEDTAPARFTRMSTTMFRDRYEPVEQPNGITGYQLLGFKPDELFEAGTDDDALRNGHIAITPLRVLQDDLEALAALESRAGLLAALSSPAPVPFSGRPRAFQAPAARPHPGDPT